MSQPLATPISSLPSDLLSELVGQLGQLLQRGFNLCLEEILSTLPTKLNCSHFVANSALKIAEARRCHASLATPHERNGLGLSQLTERTAFECTQIAQVHTVQSRMRKELKGGNHG